MSDQVNGEGQEVVNGDHTVQLSADMEGIHIEHKEPELQVCYGGQEHTEQAVEQATDDSPHDKTDDHPEDTHEDKHEDSAEDKPEDKPEDKSEDTHEDKPEDKHEDKTEDKPEDKPEDKHEDKTEDKPEDTHEEPGRGDTPHTEEGKPTLAVEVGANLTGSVDVEDKDKDKTEEDKKSDKDEEGKKDKEKDENEDEKKKPVNGTKTPKNKDKNGKGSNPNSPARKILRFFACGSDSKDVDDNRKSIEGEKYSVSITDGAHSRKVDFGMSLATKVADIGEGKPSTHIVTNVARNGIADQFGIREGDEMLMLNYFPLSGKSNKEVAMLFEEETLPRKSHLLFRRRVPAGKTTAHDYHFVTGDIVELEHPDGETSDKVEYHVNNLTHHIVRDTASEVIVAPPEKVHVQFVANNQLYFCFQNDQLSAVNGFDSSDKFTYEMIVRIVISPTAVPEVVFRHKKDGSENYMFMNESDVNMVMQEEQSLSGSLPQTLSPSETLLYKGISNAQQIYAFESVVKGGNYMSVKDSEVMVHTMPDGRTLSDDTAFHFHVYSQTG